MILEDILLVRRFNRGEAAAIRSIYEKYKNGLVTLAAALLNDVAAAEDVVHDVFVTFIRTGGQFRLTGSLKGYLSTCVANAARNAIRARQRQTSLDGVEPAVSETSGPDCKAVFGEESRRVASALNGLPYEQREVVLLHIKCGLKFAAIAQSQGVSINTVQGRYRYALEKLRSQLDGEVQK